MTRWQGFLGQYVIIIIIINTASSRERLDRQDAVAGRISCVTSLLVLAAPSTKATGLA
jgi:hypothetical protein